MRTIHFVIHILSICVIAVLCLMVVKPMLFQDASEIKPASQNPSPMAENIRRHERVEEKECPGLAFQTSGILNKPIDIFLPEKVLKQDSASLLIHFHGAAYIPKYAVHESDAAYILAVINLGSGSSVYERAMNKITNLSDFSEKIISSIYTETNIEYKITKMHLSGFSAGYGGIRAILRNESNIQYVDGVLLLDGLHTDYIPAGVTMHRGGKLNEEKLQPFLNFAKLAAIGEKRFAFTHSEIFPGTYASTTEAADYLLEKLSLKGEPTLNWGPLGMQAVREIHQNGFHILSFAGNTAPDHVDHFHGMHTFLKYLNY